MRLKGEKIYIQQGLNEGDYPIILKGYTDLSVIGFVSFAKETVGFKTINEAKAFVNGIENETVFGIYTYDEKFIGYASLEPEGDDACEYSIFILDKNYWGKGIGEEVTKIMLEHIFQALGFKKATLTTSESHEKAIALYEKVGFRKTKMISNDREIFLDGKWIKSGTVEMVKLCD
jgi:ribosomal protein S18 acetylase RimI-like enzyme